MYSRRGLEDGTQLVLLYNPLLHPLNTKIEVCMDAKCIAAEINFNIRLDFCFLTNNYSDII